MAVTKSEELLPYLEQLGVVPLVTLHSLDEAVPLAQALEEGGVPVAEVTFRSPFCIEGMKKIAAEVPGVTLVAGTVHTLDQAKASVDAGAKGLVTPAFTEEIVDWALENNVPILPGTAVPSDVDKAYQRGMRYVKFFPAEAYGGVKTLKALNGPFAEMKFLPTGGVSLKNAADYISLKNVFAIGGSFPVPSAAQKVGDWAAVAQACKDSRAIVEPIIASKNA